VRTTRVFFVLLIAATAVVTGACDKAAPAASGAAPKSAASPAGGWPQAADGVVDEKMCAIVTADDFATFHRVATDKVETDKLAGGGNGIVCNYALDDTVTLELAGDQTDAGLTYAASLAGYRKQAKNGGSTVVSGLVKGATDSWYDQEPKDSAGNPGDSRLVARRGALIVEIHLQGFYPGGKGSDPKATSAGLAALVFERAPKLGQSADTASGAAPAGAHTVVYRIAGAGPIAGVTYDEPIGLKFQTVHNVRAPWTLALPLAAAQLGQPVELSLTANSTDPNAMLACQVEIDGKVVTHESRPGFLTMCSYTWKG
jgi:hypothetical protein